MAFYITNECINCGACLYECPANAVYQAGKYWEHKNILNPPLEEEFYFIVPDKCHECEGHSDIPLCVSICPMDCIKPVII